MAPEKMPGMPYKLVDAKYCCKLLGICKKKWMKLQEEWGINRIVLGHRTVRWRLDQVLYYLEIQTTK